MKVNIVMLTHNRPRLTMQALRSLRENTPRELYNLTVIDDCSSDRYIYDLNVNTAVLRIETSKGITGQARNLGVYWAEKYWGHGDYLYLSDNDMYFTPGWLVDLAHALESGDERVKVLGGWNHPFLQRSEYLSKHWMVYDPMDKHLLEIYSHDAVAGASQLMRWETWDKYGPLDAHAVGVGQSEDWKFCQDIIKGGGRVGSIYPRVVLNCGLTNSFGQPSPGADVRLKELQEAKRQYPELYWK